MAPIRNDHLPARKRRHTTAVATACFVATTWLIANTGGATEGMWLPEQLPALEGELVSYGLQIDVATLAALDTPPLGAVISLGGCSASFVSAEGLAVTNHHCAEGALQLNSTPERNLLDEGFFARQRAEELWAGPGSRILITDVVRDVTDQIAGAIPEGATDRERYDATESARKELVAECEADPGFRCAVVAFHGGGTYRLIRQREIQDVRLVFAPPTSIGFFGGEIDNWMWPRHAGDFTFYRAYVGQDGAPAPHAADNIPYTPEHVLQVNPQGVDDGDFVMVAGYPGRTYRYRSARELEHARDNTYPWQIEVLTDLRGLLEARMEEDAEAAVRLTSSVFRIGNVLKNNQGMLDGFARGGAVERAFRREEALFAGLHAHGSDGATWAAAIHELDDVLAERMAEEERSRLTSWMLRNVRLLGAASTTYRLAMEREREDDLERDVGFQERDWPRIRDGFARIERTYDPVADERVFAYFLERIDQLPADRRVAAVDILLDPLRGEDAPYAALAARFYSETYLTQSEHRDGWLDARVVDFEHARDPIVALAVALEPMLHEQREADRDFAGTALRLRPAYVEALEATASRPLYPDANSTLRVTFGLVRGYDGPDAVWYRPHTTLAGILEKETGEDPFTSPDALRAAILEGDFGPYASAELGSVPVNFLTTLDATGGNSGSATLDAHGRLVGLLFDGNYEAMASDWLFDPVRTRSIHVDIRYMLWVLDRVYGMHDLLREIGVEPYFR